MTRSRFEIPGGRRRTAFLACLVAALIAAPVASAAADPAPSKTDAARLRELIRKADRILRGDTSAAVVKMRIKTADYDRTYEMVLWDDSRNTPKSLVKILGPALWRGWGTLKVGSRLLTYDPRTDHVTVVGSSMLGDSWMGSHFSNDDLVKETQLDVDYVATLEEERDAPDPEPGASGTVRAYRIKLSPTPRAPVVWGAVRMQVYAKGDRVVPQQIAYFRDDKPGAEVDRTLFFSDVKDLGGRVVPARMRMEVTRKPGEFTEVVYEKVRFEVAIPDGKFTEQALRQ